MIKTLNLTLRKGLLLITLSRFKKKKKKKDSHWKVVTLESLIEDRLFWRFFEFFRKERIHFRLEHNCHWNFKWSRTLKREGDCVDLQHCLMKIVRFIT